MFVGGLPPPSLELESQRPPNFSVPSTYARAVRQTAARVCRVIKLDERKTFMASTRPHTPKKICDTNADMQSVCGNVLVTSTVLMPTQTVTCMPLVVIGS